MEQPGRLVASLAPPRRRGAALPLLTLAPAEWAVLRALLPLALIQGLLYVLLLPPWQHYDETAHFLYAAEIAAGEYDRPGPASAALRREITDSMYRFGFFPPEVRPDLLAFQPPEVGLDQRVHPPLYYAFVAMPLRLLRGLAVEEQLYAARALSALLYGLTVLTSWRIAVAVAPDETLIQWALPLLVLLVPAFVDIMTAVNNDVLLNFSAAVAILGAVLLVRDGLRPMPLALALLGTLCAILAKRVGLLVCLPVALALLWSLMRRRLRWWLLPSLAMLAATLFGALAFRGTVVDGPSGPHTVLSVRPWFVAIDESYLRLSLDASLRSLTDAELIGDRYSTLLRVAFSGYYTHFAWGGVMMHPAWAWLLAALAALATLGLLAGGFGARVGLALWQRRCVWLFLLAVSLAWVSIVVRLHPLPPLSVPVYIPRGRYMYWAIVPNLWLFAAGLTWLAPAAWRRPTLYALVGFFLALSFAAWLVTIPAAFYR